jgi:hypothetical protein
MDYLEKSLQNIMKDCNIVMQYACDNNGTTKFKSKISDESKKMAMMKHERNVSKQIGAQNKCLIKDEIIKVSRRSQKRQKMAWKQKWGCK